MGGIALSTRLILTARKAFGGLAMATAFALVCATAPNAATAVRASEIVDFPVTYTSAIARFDGAGSARFTISVDAGTYRDGAGTVRAFATSKTWVCQIQANNPHYSRGAAGVIAKSTVSCKGPAATIPVNVYMILGRSSHSSGAGLKFVRESQYTQNVVVNFGTTTWYVPRTGTAGAKRGAYFKASAAGAAAPPLLSIGIGTHASALIYVG